MNRQFILRASHLLLTLWVLCQVSYGQEILSLAQCLGRVRSANPDMRQLALTQETRDLQTQINARNYLPKASLNGRAAWQSDVTNIGMDFPGFDIPTPDRDQYAATLDVSQSVYDGGYTSAQRQVLEQEAALSTLQYETGIQSVEDMATDFFYQVLLQQQLVLTSDLLIGQLKQVIKTLEDNYANGMLNKQDLLAARVKLMEAQQKREEAVDNTTKVKNTLATLMDMGISDFIISDENTRVQGASTGSFEQRPEMRLLHARTQLIKDAERLNRTQYHPGVSVFANLGYGKPGLNFLSDAFDTYFTTGVSVHIPLSQYYTGKRSREAQVFQLQQESLELNTEKVLRDFHIKEQQHLDEINKLNSWLIEDAEIIDLRKEMRDIARARHNAGTITVTDYLDTLTDLFVAEELKITHEVLLRREQALLYQLYGI